LISSTFTRTSYTGLAEEGHLRGQGESKG